MKKILLLFGLLILFGGLKAQFNPNAHISINDALGQNQSAPIEGRGLFWDAINFKWRDYQSTAEVLSTLPTNANRFSHFPVYIHSGGTLSGGVWTGGTTLVYFFKDGLADGNLVRWYTDSVIVRVAQDSMWRVNDSTIAFTINGGPTRTVLVRGTSGGGISALTLSVPSSLYTNPVSFSNSGGAWSGSLVLNNQNPHTFFAGPSIGSAAQPAFRSLVTADLPTGIPNANLQNSSITFGLGSSGTSPSWSSPSASLGGPITFNLPTANNVNSGILSSADWNRFNSVVAGTVISVNGQAGIVIAKNADSIKSLPVDTSINRNNYLLAFDSVGHKWYLSAPGASSGSVTIVTSGNIPNLATVSVATNTSTPAFTFTPISQTQNLVFASPNGSTGNPTFRSLVNADLPTSGVSAGTYNSLTVNAQGIVTAGTSVGSGIATLNTLTASTQTFAIGTSGTDFNISSVTSTHTFNIPIASATNTGKLSNTDWSTFNAKQTAGNYIVSLTTDVVTSGFSGGSAVATIQPNAVTLAKQATNTANTLQGFNGSGAATDVTFSTTGSGAPTLTGSNLNIPPGTLTYTQNALNNTLAYNPGNSVTFLIASATKAGLIDSAHYHYLDSLFLGQKTFTLNALQGLYAINSNTIGLGGNPFTLPDTIKTAGFAFSITGLPNKATALGTDSVMIEDAAGKIWKLPVPAGGGGGTPGGSNTQVQFNNSGSFGGSANLTWSGTVLSTTGLTATGVTTLSGVTYSGGGATFDVLVTDTTSGKVWRQPYYPFDTTGFAGGSTNVIFNGTKLLLNAGGGGSFSYTVATPPATANYTVTTSNFILLPDLTGQANRNIVLPTSPLSGAILTVKNNNTVTSTFNWTFTNGTVKSYTNTSITTLSTLTVYNLVFDGTNWDITN